MNTKKLVESLDLISQSIPPSGPSQTLSQIQFSADGLSLIVSVKGYNTTMRDYLLFYQLSSNSNMLSSSPIVQTPPNGILPFSMTLVGTNGLLVTDPGAQDVLTQTYSSTSGTVTNSVLTSINASVAGALCWSTYSPTIGNYYVIAAAPAAFVELNLNLSSNSNPVQIIKYYPLANNTDALETTVVTLAGMDYLYIIDTTAQAINSYRLNGPGNAAFSQVVSVPQTNMTNIPKIAEIAANVQMRAASNMFYRTTIMFWLIVIFTYCYNVYGMN